MTDETPTETKPAAKTRATKAAVEPQKNIYQLISLISEEAGALAPESKGGVPFAFRGIDGTVAHLSPFLRKYGVVVIPNVIKNDVTARDLPGNKALTQSSITTEFTFYAPDGSSLSATTVGLAQDHSDRAAAQAQSVAFRVALLQVFALPTHSKEPEELGEENRAYIEKANAQAPQPTAAPQAPAGPTAAVLKTQIASELKSQNIVGPKAIKEYGDKFYGVTAEDQSKAKWHEAPAALTKLLTHIQAENAKAVAAAAETGADAATGEVS